MIGNSGKPRILAFFIDNLIATVVALLLVVLLGSSEPLTNATVVCLTYLFYYLVFEALLSRTPGKFVQGLEVRKLDGSKCDLKAAAIRTLLRIFEVNPLFMGGLPAGIAIISSARKQRLGDKLAGTVVISSKA